MNEILGQTYNPDSSRQWEESKTMEHASGIWGRESMLKLLQQEIIEPGDTVVDLGSGGGYPSAKMAEMVGEKGKVVGVELVASQLGLEEGQTPISQTYKDVPNLRFFRADTLKLPIQSETADVVTSFMVMHNLKMDEVKKMLRETHAILKPEGKAVFLSMHPEALNSEWDLDFMRYAPEDIATYRAADNKNDILVHGTVKNAGGGKKQVFMYTHSAEAMTKAINEAGLQLESAQELWIDKDTAIEKFGKAAVKKLPDTPTFQIMILKKAAK